MTISISIYVGSDGHVNYRLGWIRKYNMGGGRVLVYSVGGSRNHAVLSVAGVGASYDEGSAAL